jgi:hypothetical protein
VAVEVVLNATVLSSRGLDQRERGLPQVLFTAGFRLHLGNYSEQFSHVSIIPRARPPAPLTNPAPQGPFRNNSANRSLTVTAPMRVQSLDREGAAAND